MRVVVEGAWARVTGDDDDVESERLMQCLRQPPWTRGRLLQDVYWFTSREKDVIIYLGNASEVVLTWDYLTRAQKAVEVVIVAVMVVMLVAALLGNSLVLLTMLTSERSDALWVMRASLAASDLLRATTVMPLALHHTLSLMTQPEGLLDVKTRGGGVTFVGVVFWVTSLASVQSLAWLSVERVVLCGFPHCYRHLTAARVRGVLVLVWLLAVGLPIAILLLAQGRVTNFDVATKLTLLFPDGGAKAPAHAVFLGLRGYLAGLSMFTVTASVLAVWAFRARALKEDEDAKRHSPVSCIRRKEKDDRAVQSTMLLMLVTYLVSTPPFLLLLLLQPPLPSLPFMSHARDLRCVIPWLFVFTSSWQWYVYNLRSDVFRRCVARMFLRCVFLPEGLKERLKVTATSDNALTLDWGHAWYEIHAFIRRKSTVGQSDAKGVGVEGVEACVVEGREQSGEGGREREP